MDQEMMEFFASGEWEKCHSSEYWEQKVKELDEQMKPSNYNPFGVNVVQL